MCGVSELGQIRVFRSTAIPPTINRVYAAVGGRVGVEVPLDSFVGFRISGEVLGTANHVQFSINDRPGWITPNVSGGLGAGLYIYY